MSDRKHEPLDDIPKRPGNKKNTKKWCLGREGRDHQWAWVPHPRWPPDWALWVQLCTVCKKELSYCRPKTWRSGKCICGHHER